MRPTTIYLYFLRRNIDDLQKNPDALCNVYIILLLQ